MKTQSKLEQLQLISRHLLLVEGPPNPDSEMARLLHEQRVPFQFYNLQLDQEVRMEVVTSI